MESDKKPPELKKGLDLPVDSKVRIIVEGRELTDEEIKLISGSGSCNTLGSIWYRPR
jgi:hypothetical protein